MKTRTSSLLVLTASFAACAFTSACTTHRVNQAFSHAVGSVARPGNTDVARGTTKTAVRQSLGEPGHQLSADVWAYYHFNGGYYQQPDDDCSTLLVTFAEGRVADLQLINDRAQIVYAAQLRAKENNRIQVAAK